MTDKFIILGNIDISPFLRALEQFNSANKENSTKSNIEKAGLIKFFEFTYELAWKSMKRVLEVNKLADNFRKLA